jgi:hypothetical protein
MQIENYIRSISRRILFQRMRIDNIRDIKTFISRLKTERRYLRYPFDEYPPTIANYSLFHKSDLKWFDFYYSVYGKPDPNFISVPDYLYIETCLNDRMLINGIKEKNFYNKYWTGIPTPATALRRINGLYYDDKFQKIDRKDIMTFLNRHKKLILKPSLDTGGGKSILVFENNNGIFNNGEFNLNPEFIDSYSRDFIIQEFIIQHSFFSRFNPSCNNTIKIFVYRSIKDDSINLLHAILWIGAKGSFLDHDHWGGFGLSINGENKLNKYALDMYGNKYESVNNIVLSSLGKVPAMHEMKALANKVANNIYYARLLALDFTVNSNGDPLLLEMNCYHNGIHQHQMHNGGLFNEFTKEILDYCQSYQPRFVVRI